MWRAAGITATAWVAGAIALRVTLAPAQVCPAVTVDGARDSAYEAAAWIERAQADDGSYLYDWDRETGEPVPGYNSVRHAGVTMSLYQLAAETGDLAPIAPADRGLAWMQERLFQRDGWTAMDVPGEGVKLGGNALLLAGLAQRRLATGDGQHDDLMRAVARFLVVLQGPDGSFSSRWLPETGRPNTERSLYATGEAFWALALMHRLFPGEGWDVPVRAVADYLALHRDEVENTKFPPWADQWAAYGFAEMAPLPGLALSDDHVAYVRSLADRFGFLIRADSQRTDGAWSKLIHGRRARAAGAGTWVEALGSLWRLSQADPRLAGLAPKLAERGACGAGMLRDRQITESEAAGKEHAAILGGAWFTEDRTRMDDQQHALSALIRARELIAAHTGKAND
ncbi:MAG: hypothetical protein ACKVVT_02075 [Dehalococcoidia bacterium]